MMVAARRRMNMIILVLALVLVRMIVRAVMFVIVLVLMRTVGRLCQCVILSKARVVTVLVTATVGTMLGLEWQQCLRNIDTKLSQHV